MLVANLESNSVLNALRLHTMTISFVCLSASLSPVKFVNHSLGGSTGQRVATYHINFDTLVSMMWRLVEMELERQHFWRSCWETCVQSTASTTHIAASVSATSASITSTSSTWTSVLFKSSRPNFLVCISFWASGYIPLVWKTWKCQGIWQLSGKCQGFYWKSGNCQGKKLVREKLPKNVHCKLHICVHTGI